MARTLAFLFIAAAAGLPLGAAAQGRGLPTYEPQQRLRTALDTCTKTEVMRNAMCVKKCAAGFRMDMSGAKPVCIGLKPDAKYTPPEPGYKPNPNNKRTPQGSQG